MINKILLSTILLLSNCNIIVSQNNKWTKPTYTFLEGKVSRLDGNIRYTVDSTMHIAERNDAIKKTKEYILNNLELINESEFNDSIHIVLAHDRDEMAKYIGGRIIGMSIPKDQHVPENMIFCIYGTKHTPLKHELMHMITTLKWGGSETNNGRAPWLEEGLAVFANPEAENCDGHTIEERYAYLLQSNKLLDFNSLFTSTNTTLDYKISYTQSAYIVGYLINKYGIEKLKTLWKSNVKDFDDIYGATFEEVISDINNYINKKYPESIDFNWELFIKNCIE